MIVQIPGPFSPTHSGAQTVVPWHLHVKLPQLPLTHTHLSSDGLEEGAWVWGQGPGFESQL